MTVRARPKREARKLSRRANPTQASRERILIVTEGAKTEPSYLAEIRREGRISAASLAVHHSEAGTDPLSVVTYAEGLVRSGSQKLKLQAYDFDTVYVVFDRDNHMTYHAALNLVQTLNGRFKNNTGQRIRFVAVVSIPCFELWVLLHFRDVHAPMSAAEALRAVRGYIPTYSKGIVDLYARIGGETDHATQRAERLARTFSQHSAPEPYTDFHTLAGKLLRMRNFT